MKKWTFFLITLLSLYGCVQKTHTKTVVYYCKIHNIRGIQSVGIRGKDKPLNWNEDCLMNVSGNDSLYKIVVTYNTGYRFTEVKFVVNGKYELQDKPNRRVEFTSQDTTIYKAEFNKIN